MNPDGYEMDRPGDRIGYLVGKNYFLFIQLFLRVDLMQIMLT
jgi:hypothetical protein